MSEDAQPECAETHPLQTSSDHMLPLEPDLLPGSAQHRLRGRDQLASRIGAELGAGRSVSLVGRAGVGKSHLARSVVSRRFLGSPRTEAVLRITGSSWLQDHALGTLRPNLKPVNGQAQTVELLANAIEDIGSYDLILLDDADAVDDLSALVLAQAVQHRSVCLLMTMRSNTQLPASLEGLVNGPAGVRHMVERLPANDVNLLISDLCQAAPHHDLEQAVEGLAAGNPLHVRELVLGGLETSRIVLRGGFAELDGQLDETPRISHLIGTRILALPPATRAALESCLIATALPRSLIDKLDPTGGCVLLEERLLLDSVASRSDWVSAAHPLVSTWERRIDPERRDHLLQQLLVTDKDLNRRTRWTALLKKNVSPSDAVLAVGELERDFGPKAALAVLEVADQTGEVLLARIGVLKGDTNQTKVRALLQKLLSHDQEVVRATAALELSDFVAYAEADPSQARSILAACIATGLSAPLLAQLQARHASLALISEATEDDLNLAMTVLESTKQSTSVTFDAAVAALPLLLTSGEVNRVDEVSKRCRDSVHTAAQTQGWRSFLYTSGVGWYHMVRGETIEAISLGNSQLNSIPSNEVIARTGVGNTVAWFELIAGDLVEAAHLAESTWRPAIGADLFGFAAPARHQLIWFLTMLGEDERAQELGPIGPDPGPKGVPMFRVMWAAACDALAISRGLSEEATHLQRLSIGFRSPARWLQCVALWTLFPDGNRSADAQVLQWADAVDDRSYPFLVTDLATEATSRSADNAEALLRCALRHGEAGRWLWAGATAGLAARSSGSTDIRFTSEGLIRTAKTHTSALAGPWAFDEPTLLTNRQWEVVELVTGGASNRQASAELFVAPRTIETHLANIFQLTGLRSRESLGQHLHTRPVPTASPTR